MSDESDNQREHDLIYDRYELVRELGTGGQATTWLARDLATETDVALKELALDRVVDWKSVELFEREGQALASIDHPQVPDYVDAFHIEGEEDGSRFFLVQEYVAGESLAARIERGVRIDVEDAADMLESLLSVLAYLHERSPPIIHRDIKPSNILVDEGGEPVLVDFGAVQLVLPGTVGGSTIIGTTGFFPIEQLMGKAVPASDLYALGATMVHVLSGRHPAELDMERNRLQFEGVVSVPAWLESYLGRLLEPAAEDRFADAGAALSHFRTLREGGHVPPSDTGANKREDSDPTEGWLDVVAGRVLVEDRATDETVFRVDCATGTQWYEIERKPGVAELVLQPDRAELVFETGPARQPIAIGGIMAMLGLGLLLVVPLAPFVRFTGFVLGVLCLGIYGRWRYKPRTRQVLMDTRRLEIRDEFGASIDPIEPAHGRFEQRGDDVVLVADEGEPSRVVAGLGEDRARWLAAKLEGVRGHLVDRTPINLEPDPALIESE